MVCVAGMFGLIGWDSRGVNDAVWSTWCRFTYEYICKVFINMCFNFYLIGDYVKLLNCRKILFWNSRIITLLECDVNISHPSDTLSRLAIKCCWTQVYMRSHSLNFYTVKLFVASFMWVTHLFGTFLGNYRFRRETLSTLFDRWIKTGMKGSIMEELAFSLKVTLRYVSPSVL